MSKVTAQQLLDQIMAINSLLESAKKSLTANDDPATYYQIANLTVLRQRLIIRYIEAETSRFVTMDDIKFLMQ